MKNIHVSEITEAVRKMCISANCYLGDDVKDALKKYKDSEKNETAAVVLEKLLQNAEIAKTEHMPICQDTGMAVFFVELGCDVHITGGLLSDAINEGVRRGYKDGYLRKSVVSDPLRRKNTSDNTPAVIHYDIKEGTDLKITFAPKGFGSENMSALKMLKPSDGIDGIKEFVTSTVKAAGASPCPPIVVGVGIGGTMEKCAFLSKLALTRPVGSKNKDPFYSDLENALLSDINSLGIGPQGFGGKTTALAVHIETYPTHIAGLPCSVNINCHVARHEQIIL